VNWGSWLDEYDREARLVPALLTALPLALAAIGLGFEDNAILVSVIAVLLTVGLPMVVAKRVADRGRVIEAALFLKWGAPPTTLMLVPPADGPVGEILRQRRARLAVASGISLPTNPVLTGSEIETYQAAVRWLIENTRDHTKFPVVWAEPKNYGFDRNTLGLRIMAQVTSAPGVLALSTGATAGALGADVSIWPNLVLAVVCTTVGLWWWRVPSEDRVRTAADRYAERLLDASAVLP
jgi:hypothetical protein